MHKYRMSFKLSCTVVLRCDTVEHAATLNDRSLAAIDAGIDRISLAKLDKRGNEGELTRHQILTGSNQRGSTSLTVIC